MRERNTGNREPRIIGVRELLKERKAATTMKRGIKIEFSESLGRVAIFWIDGGITVGRDDVQGSHVELTQWHRDFLHMPKEGQIAA